MKNFKKRIYSIIEKTGTKDKWNKIFNIFILSLISINVISIILETEKAIYKIHSKTFYIIEIVSVIIFSIEYLLRLYVCTEDKKFSHPIKGRIKFIFTFYPLIDLIAILPFFLPMLFVIDLRFIRIIRYLRIFRIFKLGKYSSSFRILKNVIKDKLDELGVILFTIFLLLIISSTLIYYAEHNAQPEIFSSIPASIWWGIVTLTTVGYGDLYLVTVFGKIIGSFVAIMGIGLFALPTGILASGFSEELDKRKKKVKKCPHCKEDIS